MIVIIIILLLFINLFSIIGLINPFKRKKEKLSMSVHDCWRIRHKILFHTIRNRFYSCIYINTTVPFIKALLLCWKNTVYSSTMKQSILHHFYNLKKKGVQINLNHYITVCVLSKTYLWKETQKMKP